MLYRLLESFNCPASCRRKCLSISVFINIIFCTSLIIYAASTSKLLLFCAAFVMAGINMYDLFMRPINI